VGSSLYRLSLGEHDRVKIHKDDTVFFSADPAPAYSKESQDLVIDNLIDLGADVHYYALREGLYVSGHGGQEDIKQLFKLVKPKYLLPIGGTIRFMHAYEKLAAAAGYDETRVFKLKAGESVIFENGLAKRGETVSTRDVLVHGLGIGDIGKVVLADRTLLGNEGAAVVVMKISRQGTLVGNIEIMSRGFVFEEKSLKLLREAGLALAAEIHKRKAKGKKNLQEVTVNFLRWYFFQKTGRNPMLIPVIVEL
jgi:ribonuclease J